MINYEKKLHEAVVFLLEIQSGLSDESELFQRIMWFLDTAYEDEQNEEDSEVFE